MSCSHNLQKQRKKFKRGVVWGPLCRLWIRLCYMTYTIAYILTITVIDTYTQQCNSPDV